MFDIDNIRFIISGVVGLLWFKISKFDSFLFIGLWSSGTLSLNSVTFLTCKQYYNRIIFRYRLFISSAIRINLFYEGIPYSSISYLLHKATNILIFYYFYTTILINNDRNFLLYILYNILSYCLKTVALNVLINYVHTFYA